MKTLVGAAEPEPGIGGHSIGWTTGTTTDVTGVVWWRPAKPGETPGQMEPELREPYRTVAVVGEPSLGIEA